MSNLGPVDASVLERTKIVKGEHGFSSNNKTLDFILDFYFTLRDQGALEVFQENADALKKAIFALSAKPALRKLQIKSLRAALDEAERGVQ